MARSKKVGLVNITLNQPIGKELPAKVISESKHTIITITFMLQRINDV